MASHKDLNGADLHELKGADTATANSVPVADGIGSHVWKKITSASIDATSIKNINKSSIAINIDTTAAFDIYVPVVVASTLDSVTFIISEAVAGANFVINVYKNASLVGSVTFNVAEPAGTKKTVAVPTSLLTSDYLRLQSSATSVTDGAPVIAVLNYSL